jgi:hypothetical protein
VVDLRGLSDDELNAGWTTDRIEKLAHVVSDIGTSVSETCELVDVARSSTVGIRNEAALRYEIPEATGAIRGGAPLRFPTGTVLRPG